MKIITPKDINWGKLVIDVLKAGGVVLHPTDTAYGLAVDSTNKSAIQKVFDLKQRSDKPLIMVIRDHNQAEEYVEFNPTAEILMKEFFPGALTLVLPKKVTVPDLLTCGLGKVGIRQPGFYVTQTISQVYPNPYTSTSANLSGGKTPYTITKVLDQLDSSRIDLAIDVGPLPIRPTSTVVDLTTSSPQILREGAIKAATIFNILG